jgi:hypothetical protein
MAEYDEQNEPDTQNGNEREQSELSSAISGLGGARTRPARLSRCGSTVFAGDAVDDR